MSKMLRKKCTYLCFLIYYNMLLIEKKPIIFKHCFAKLEIIKNIIIMNSFVPANTDQLKICKLKLISA